MRSPTATRDQPVPYSSPSAFFVRQATSAARDSGGFDELEYGLATDAELLRANPNSRSFGMGSYYLLALCFGESISNPVDSGWSDLLRGLLGWLNSRGTSRCSRGGG